MAFEAGCRKSIRILFRRILRLTPLNTPIRTPCVASIRSLATGLFRFETLQTAAKSAICLLVWEMMENQKAKNLQRGM